MNIVINAKTSCDTFEWVFLMSRNGGKFLR